MYNGVIFDLDGTLLNTLDDLAAAGNFALEKMSLPTHKPEAYKYFVGNGIPKLIQRILPQNTDQQMLETALAFFSQYYGAHSTDLTVPYDGITELLTELQRMGVKTACVTNKAHNFSIELVKKYFGNTINVVVGANENRPKKPNPAAVYEALKLIETDKSETLYVGDSDVDMQTAQNAGLVGCGVLWGFRTRDELLKNGADIIVSNSTELLNIIKNNT